MENFKVLGLPEALNHTLEHMKFSVPTPIQAQAIPPALEGRDILGSAQTGTGKTGAFGIPLVNYLMTNPQGTALVMTPTRELALQVLTQLQMMLGRKTSASIKAALLIGGDSMNKQLGQLKQRPRLYVGTPGRINDHLQRGSLKLNDTRFLVLDETDRMLDMGFTIQIERILKYVPKDRQTLLFSATLPDNIVSIATRYMNDPVRVAVDPISTPAKNIKQEVVHTTEGEKYDLMINQLKERQGSVIMFVKTKYGTEKMAKKLEKEGHSVAAIHGDLRQSKRDRVIAEFRNYKHRILVATDVASRGLDIPHIEHVINYDLPQCAEDYIHRIGRTARAGAEGSALCFVTPGDRAKWKAIQRLLNPEAANAERPRRERSERSEQPRQHRQSQPSHKPRAPRVDVQQPVANADAWVAELDESIFEARPERSEKPRRPQHDRRPQGEFKAKPKKRSEANRYPETREMPRKHKAAGEQRSEWKEKPQRSENREPRSEWKGKGQFEGKRRFENKDRSEKRTFDGKRQWEGKRDQEPREARPQTDREQHGFKAKPSSDRQIPRAPEGNRSPKRHGHNKPFGKPQGGKKKFFGKKGGKPAMRQQAV